MSKEAKILIVEDDTDLTEAMKVTLEAEHYRVFSTTTPEEGLSIAKKEKPDLIILDVMFGEDDRSRGFDCAMKIKQDRQLAPIPILMVTSINVRYPEFHFSPQSDGEYLPVDDFVDKPAKPKELVEKVRKLLAIGVSKWVNWPHPADEKNKG